MYTEKTKQESPLSVVNVNMAFEQFNRPKNIVVERPTTEEHEKIKEQTANQISEELINSFSPEDRLDIFNSIRKSLETALKNQAEEMAYKIESDNRYFEVLQNIIY